MAPVAGTWRLAEWTGSDGPAQGLLILTHDGWYAMNVTGTTGIVAAEAGSYDVEGDLVTMTPEVSGNPNTIGSRRARRWQQHGGVLELEWDGTDTRWHRALDEVVDSMGG